MPTKGTTPQRGYGHQHRQLRDLWRPYVEAGAVDCARCGSRITPGTPWDLGHIPGSAKRTYRGPEHRGCNRDTHDERQTADPSPRPGTRW